ncbi:MAG: hypothetical protein AB7P00_19765 [Sandaracinaceae bacterium]
MLASVIALALLSIAGTASAQARSVVLAELDGSVATMVRRTLREGLGSRGVTVTMGEGNPGDDAGAITAMIQSAGADAYLGGSATGRARGPWRVDLVVRDTTGGEQGHVRMRVANPRRRGALIAAVAEALALVPTASSPTAPETSGEPVAGEGAVASSDPAQAQAEAGGSAGGSAGPAMAAPAREPHPPPPILRAWLVVGGGLRSRHVELLAPDGVDAGYLAEPYAELTARAGVRLVDIVFARFAFGSSVGLDSRRETPSLGNVDTWFYWMQGDVGASFWIDDTVEIGAAFGAGWDRYELSFNELVPTAEYVHVRPAILTGFQLVDRLLMLDAELGLRIPFGVGDLTSLHGTSYSVIGVDGAMRIHGVIDPGFVWGAELGFRHYALHFDRPGGGVSGTDSGWNATLYAGWELSL